MAQIPIKKTLSHLLHGSEGDYVARMADCIFDLNYRLQDFGESCAPERRSGWVNNEDVPTCNSRTLKSLRWLGFDRHSGVSVEVRPKVFSSLRGVSDSARRLSCDCRSR